eukprot:SAG22_NODE_15654_length_344_cov_0.632653_1_plen_83_part_10
MVNTLYLLNLKQPHMFYCTAIYIQILLPRGTLRLSNSTAAMLAQALPRSPPPPPPPPPVAIWGGVPGAVFFGGPPPVYRGGTL